MLNPLMNRICNNRHEQQEGKVSEKFSRKKQLNMSLLEKAPAVITQPWTSKHCLDCSQFCAAVGNMKIYTREPCVSSFFKKEEPCVPSFLLLQMKKALKGSEKKEGNPELLNTKTYSSCGQFNLSRL